MIKNLELIHFRNFKELSITFETGVHAITGFNGQGKTNLLEAIFILSQTKSFRPGLAKDWVQAGADYSMIMSIWEQEDFHQINWAYQSGKPCKILTDNQITKAVDHVGKIPLICIKPEDIFLIQEGGTERRNWLNAWISQFNTEYLLHLISWEKNIKQRNSLLEAALLSGNLDKNLIELYDNQLIQSGMYIHQERTKVIQNLNVSFQKIHQQLCAGQEKVELKLESIFQENTIQEWTMFMQQSFEKDKRTARTQVGIHKEDIDFQIHGKALKLLGSQGQQKTYLIALKLSQLAYLNDQGKPPILLLDDVFDKMDEKRMQEVSEQIHQVQPSQIFLTDTSKERIEKAFKNQEVHHYHVHQASVKKM